MSDATAILLHVLVTKTHNSVFLGQCLEHDFAVQGQTLAKLKAAFEAVLHKQLEISVTRGLESLAHLPEAPQHFHQMYLDAVTLPMVVRPENGLIRVDFALLI